MQNLIEKLSITELVQSWAMYRDIGNWERLRNTMHDDATMTTTWYCGSFAGFIEALQASWRKGSRSQHFVGSTVLEIQGARAIAQTRMSILVRGLLDGQAVDVTSVGRFFDCVEKRQGTWRIAKRCVIYEKDRLDAVNPQAAIQLDPALLGKFPEGYRHLAYLQTQAGAVVNPNLPTSSGPALEHLIAQSHAWLHAA
jgi:SnoaL-like domain